jgi:hypothetical protein
VEAGSLFFWQVCSYVLVGCPSVIHEGWDHEAYKNISFEKQQMKQNTKAVCRGKAGW